MPLQLRPLSPQVNGASVVEVVLDVVVVVELLVVVVVGSDRHSHAAPVFWHVSPGGHAPLHAEKVSPQGTKQRQDPNPSSRHVVPGWQPPSHVG